MSTGDPRTVAAGSDPLAELVTSDDGVEAAWFVVVYVVIIIVRDVVGALPPRGPALARIVIDVGLASPGDVGVGAVDPWTNPSDPTFAAALAPTPALALGAPAAPRIDEVDSFRQ